jgi:hypothetical protein
MYLPRSHTENIFPSWTVVVRRHHVYVREFHLPSCNSVSIFIYLKLVLIHTVHCYGSCTVMLKYKYKCSMNNLNMPLCTPYEFEAFSLFLSKVQTLKLPLLFADTAVNYTRWYFQTSTQDPLSLLSRPTFLLQSKPR